MNALVAGQRVDYDEAATVARLHITATTTRMGDFAPAHQGNGSTESGTSTINLQHLQTQLMNLDGSFPTKCKLRIASRSYANDFAVKFTCHFTCQVSNLQNKVLTNISTQHLNHSFSQLRRCKNEILGMPLLTYRFVSTVAPSQPSPSNNNHEKSNPLMSII